MVFNNKLKYLTLMALLTVGLCDSCTNPEVQSTSFTTKDATIVTNIAYISEFSVKCETGSVSNLYADVDGSILLVAEVDQNKYQVSWTEEIKTARRGDIIIRLFDEDSYTSLKKAIRAGEDISTVKPLFSVILNHYGAFNGPWLKSEFLATALAFVVAYLALNSRTKLLS